MFVALLAPAAKVGVDFARDALGVNPIEEVLNRLGWWALALLVASLAATPAKVALGWTWPLQLRRMLGLFAFGYATLHVAFYVVVDQGLEVAEIARDVVKRRFLAVGMLAWVLLVPLAVTSTAGWVKRLGFARWKALHRLAYVAAMLGVVHFAWREKIPGAEQIVFAGILAVLLAVRGVSFARTRRARRASEAP